MKKVLIISYHAPPRNTTAAHRIEALIWNLPKFGWQAVVCSGPPLGFTLAKMLHLEREQNLSAQVAQIKSLLSITSEVSVLDKLLNLYAEVFFYPDPMKGWANTLTAKLDFERYKPDLIMSHSFPHTSHLVASKLLSELKTPVPWIASFSDLWTQSHYYPYSRFRKHREEALERRTLEPADCFITVSGPLSGVLFSRYYKAAHIIPNSYPELTDSPPLTKQFTLTYTGNFYPLRYDLELFCWAVSMHKDRWPGLQLRFYGQDYPYLVNLAQRYSMPECTFVGPESHHNSLIAQRESQVLLHFNWNGGEQGIYGAKLFEYLGARRPIISFGGADKAVSYVLDKTQSGTWCRTPDELVSELDRLYSQYRTLGSAQFNGNEQAISEYSAFNMARRHAELFDNILKEHK